MKFLFKIYHPLIKIVSMRNGLMDILIMQKNTIFMQHTTSVDESLIRFQMLNVSKIIELIKQQMPNLHKVFN